MDEPAASPSSPATPSPHGDDLPLDPNLIKVLASDSRRDILRLLKTRRMTLTEMAAALDLKKATVLEHLKRLTDAGLIRRIDDERMWVYYELTRQGGRVVNPGRTRFYLIMSTMAAAAVLLAGGVGFALLNDADGPTASPLHVTFEESAAYADGALSVQVLLDSADASGAKAYLVSEADARTLREDAGAVPGIPLTLAESEGSVARFQALSPVPSGTYYVYVVDADGRSNRDSLSPVRVPSLETQAPETIWRGIDESATFHVARDGRPASGTLLLAAAEGVLPTLQLENGTATLNASRIDALVAPSYVLQYLPAGTHVWLTLGREVNVRDAVVAITPRAVPEGALSDVRVHFARDAPHDAFRAPVRIGGENVTMAMADAAYASFSFRGMGPGDASVRVGRTATFDVEVVPHVRLEVRVENGTARATLAEPDGAPLEGALLQVDRVSVGTSNETGAVSFAAPTGGEHVLRVVADGTPVRIVDRAFLFASEGVAREAPARLSITNVTARVDDGALTASYSVTSRSVVTQTATLALIIDGQTLASEPVTLAPDERREGTLRAIARLSAGDHAIRVDVVPARSVAEGTVISTTPASNESTAPAGMDQADKLTDDVFTLRVRPPTPSLAAPTVAPPPSAGHEDVSFTQKSTPGAGAALLAAAAAVSLVLRRRRAP